WFYLSMSTDGGANYTRLPGDCEIVESTGRQCTWESPAPPTTAARLRITIEDSFYTGTFESEPFAILASTQPLPLGWSNHDIGSVAAPGGVSIGENTYSVTGSGADIWGTAD